MYAVGHALCLLVQPAATWHMLTYRLVTSHLICVLQIEYTHDVNTNTRHDAEQTSRNNAEQTSRNNAEQTQQYCGVRNVRR
jgi:hypothetical protein